MRTLLATLPLLSAPVARAGGSDGGCPGDYRLLRRWSATDSCGNESAPTDAGRIRVAHGRREHLSCLRSTPRRR